MLQTDPVPRFHGRLTAADMKKKSRAEREATRSAPRMTCIEDKKFSRELSRSAKRSIANAMTSSFKRTAAARRRWSSNIPIGHRAAKEGIPTIDRQIRSLAAYFREAAGRRSRRRARRQAAEVSRDEFVDNVQV